MPPIAARTAGRLPLMDVECYLRFLFFFSVARGIRPRGAVCGGEGRAGVCVRGALKPGGDQITLGGVEGCEGEVRAIDFNDVKILVQFRWCTIVDFLSGGRIIWCT